MKSEQSSERGQILVLLVLGVVVLLGFAALAIDGSMVYSDRRHAQMGTDAASLAGGGTAAMYMENYAAEYKSLSYEQWDCDSSANQAAQAAARSAAISRASDNDYTIDEEISDHNGVVTECGEQDNITWVEKYIDVITNVTRDTSTTFAHFVFGGPMVNRVEAVTRVRPPMNLAFGHAVVALRDDCPNSNTGGVHFDGNSTLKIKGGGVFSNACMDAGGTPNVNVIDGEISCTGDDCLTLNGGPILHDDDDVFDEGPAPMPRWAWMLPPPDCSDDPEDYQVSHTGSGDIDPGHYTNIRVNSASDELNLAPGLYCILGDFKINGGKVFGEGVTIYLKEGDFDVSGGVEINISAPVCTDCDPEIPGVLIYMAEGNTGEVSLLGNAESDYAGTVFAPDGMIEAGGTGSEMPTIHTQLIGDTVKLHGTTDVDIVYQGGITARADSVLENYR